MLSAVLLLIASLLLLVAAVWGQWTLRSYDRKQRKLDRRY